MFTREAAIDFAFENGLKGANFVYWSSGKMTVWYWDGRHANLCYGSGPEDVSTEDTIAQVLGERGDGWFISARVSGQWRWYFGQDDVVPHHVPS